MAPPAAPPVPDRSGARRMKTIRRLIYREILLAVAFVALGFLALFSFFDLVDELQSVGKTGPAGYQLVHALAYVALQVPSHLYELVPIAVLIGSIFVMARLAKSSEYTILRTSGLGPGLALKTLLKLGLAFVAVTFALGDYVAPVTDRAGQMLKVRYQGRASIGQTGAWLKERQPDATFAVNVRALAADGSLAGVRIFEFDGQGRIRALTQAESASFPDEDTWALGQVRRTEFHTDGDLPVVRQSTAPSLRWTTELSAEMVTAALLRPDRMKAVDLFQYIRHLEANGQTAQAYEIEFWRKVFYPMSCLVMLVLALPFAYLHFRSGGITGHVFGGVMVGISFFLLNNVFGFVGNLQNWYPWLTAAAPGLIYSVVSLAAFGWLVLRR
jgi:lipopolysaccharide export system permease protein